MGAPLSILHVESADLVNCQGGIEMLLCHRVRLPVLTFTKCVLLPR